jgi:hypothetical protein
MFLLRREIVAWWSAITVEICSVNKETRRVYSNEIAHRRHKCKAQREMHAVRQDAALDNINLGGEEVVGGCRSLY